MTESSAQEADSQTQAVSFEPLSWHIWRAGETPVRTLVFSLLIIAIAVVALVYHGPVMFLIALLLFASALNAYYLPVTYTLDPTGITTDKRILRYTRRWTEFQSFIRTTNGVVVSPFRNWTYLDNFRGLHLLLPSEAEQKQKVLRYLAQHLPEKKKR